MARSRPPELLLYGFLPPLLLDAALALDWFVFKKVSKHAITYAFLVVIGTTALMIPFLLYVLQLDKQGWTWEYCGLFISTLASTDALAVSAIVKGAHGPDHLTVLMEGESLLNDATSLVLFTVFQSMVRGMSNGSELAAADGIDGLQLLFSMATDIAHLALGGAIAGAIFGWLTLKLLRILRRTGARTSRELALIQGMSFLTYYVSSSELEVSGVIAVVTYGMFGAATAKFEMANTDKDVKLDALQNTIGGALNGIVFFLGGATATNFLIRAMPELHEAAISTIMYIPAIYAIMFIFRGILIFCFNELFRILNFDPLPYNALPFVTWGGLRGALSLIMAMVIAADHANKSSHNMNSKITAQIVTWTSSFVLLTLLVNATSLPKLLEKTGLLEIAPAKKHMMRKAKKALRKKTREIIIDLQNDEDELLRGVDWKTVKDFSFGNIDDSRSGVLLRQSHQSSSGMGTISEAVEKKTFNLDQSSNDIEQPLLMFEGNEGQEEGTAFQERVSKAREDAETEAPFLAATTEMFPSVSLTSNPQDTAESMSSHSRFDSVASPDNASSPLETIRPLESDLNAWWASDMERPHREESPVAAVEKLTDARLRLVWGLKRYIFSKRSEGLLSSDGARILGLACDDAIENAENPLVRPFCPGK